MPGATAPWAEIREAWIEGQLSHPKVTLKELGERFGISGQVIGRKAKRERWTVPEGAVAEIPAREIPNWGARLNHTALAEMPDPNFGMIPIGDRIQAAVEILHAIAGGATEKVAAECAGISHKTWEFWCKRVPELAEHKRQAKALRTRQRLQNIDDAGDKGDWRASAWMVERDPATRDDFQRAENTSPSIHISINVPRGEGVEAIDVTPERPAIDVDAGD